MLSKLSMFTNKMVQCSAGISALFNQPKPHLNAEEIVASCLCSLFCDLSSLFRLSLLHRGVGVVFVNNRSASSSRKRLLCFRCNLCFMQGETQDEFSLTASYIEYQGQRWITEELSPGHGSSSRSSVPIVCSSMGLLCISDARRASLIPRTQSGGNVVLSFFLAVLPFHGSMVLQVGLLQDVVRVVWEFRTCGARFASFSS